MMTRKILRCENCDDEIEKCDGCGYRFEEGDNVICYSGTVSTIAVYYDEDE